MAEGSARGSAAAMDRLFDGGTPTADDLAAALGKARAEYTVKRWWKYGQPAIDLIQASLIARISDGGTVCQSLINMHDKAVQVSFECFPIGIPVPEELRIELRLERQVR